MQEEDVYRATADGGTLGASGEVDLRRQEAQAAPDKPIGQLLADLSHEMTELVHQEVQLAKVELTEKAKDLGEGAAALAGAAVAGFLALGALVAGAIAALALAWPLWLAALAVAVVLLVVAGTAARIGITHVKRATPPVPEQALGSTKEDVAWLQKQVRSAKQ